MIRAISNSEAQRREHRRASPLWDGQTFRNVHPILPGLRATGVKMPSLGDFLCGGERRVPRGPLPSMDPRALWAQRSQSGLRVTWLGHSTTLIEIGGYRVLTDPVWGPRASPSRLIGPKRFQPVPIPLRAVREVDLVVISHDHYDHLDYPTIRQLVNSPVPLVTSLGVGAHLERWGIAPERIVELDWWEPYRLPNSDLTVTAAPSQHFSGRGFKDRNATLWSSMVIRCAERAVFFSGDTGLSEEYRLIGERLGPFDLAMLEVGAFHPAWGDIHLGPENALLAHQLLGSGRLLPVHWGTFSLALHAWDNPAEVLYAAREQTPGSLLMPQLGEPIEPAQEHDPKPWWRVVEASSEPIAPAPPSRILPSLLSESEASAAPIPAMPWPLD